MIEKRWSVVGPYAFTAAGTAAGIVQITNACEFRVKMIVRVTDLAGAPHEFEVKRVDSDTQLELGPRGNIKLRSDLSGFPIGCTIMALEQPRSDIPIQEIQRALFEEEPVVGQRSMLVSPCMGNPIGTSTDASGNVSLNVNVAGGLVPQQYTKIVLNREICSDRVATAQYYNGATLVQTLTFTYDHEDNLVEVDKS